MNDFGRDDLSEKVNWDSKDMGDGLGYDILSYDILPNGEEKEIFIEVKTTTGSINKPFDVSINEVEFSQEHSDSIWPIIRQYIYVKKSCVI